MIEGKIQILIPTRDRPEILKRLIKSWLATNKGKSVLNIIIDGDQKELYDFLFKPPYINKGIVITTYNKRYMLAVKLNMAEYGVMRGDWNGELPLALAFMGDDCVFRSEDWEERVYDKLVENKGLVYCNDLLKGEEIPNNVFIHVEILKKLGFMCPSVLQHYYIDNYWKDLGIRINNIYYFPDIIIEHMHHANKKAEKDALYTESEKLLDLDHIAYDAYVNSGRLAEDAARVLKISE